jgi:hypothetical protein
MPQFPLHWKGTKKIRAAHAKEKQQTPETCNHPNRLNLLIWTPELGPRSNFYEKFGRELQPSPSGNTALV